MNDQEHPEIPKTIAFQHPFFKRVEDIYFRLDENSGEPQAVVKLGEETVSLPFEGLRREFQLTTDTADGQLLTLLAKGLRYVKALRLGEPLPGEVVNRSASWQPLPKHKQIAYQRLALQVLGWLTGDEEIITDPEQLLQVTGDPSFRKKINEAFGEAAVALGLGRENREQVTHYLTDLANELAYIEALRDIFRDIQKMNGKIQALRRLYGTERTVLETADPVARLMDRCVAQFRDLFEQADAQTGEIMAALKNIDLQKTYIQNMRDDLHIRLMVWEEILEAWNLQPVRKSLHAEELLEKTYRFLAPRYMAVDQWVMMTKLQENSILGPDGKPVERKAKPHGRTMEWM